VLSTVPIPTFDPADPAFSVDPYPLFARLRAENPVHWSDAVRAHVVCRYDDVQRALRDPALSADRITPFYAAQNTDTRNKVETLVRYLGRWLVFRDPPDHTRLRGLVARAFTPKALAGIKPNVEAITAHLLANLDGRTECDLVADFATLLPAYVIMDMLGVPRAMLPEMKSWSDDIKLFIGTSQSTPDKYARAHRGVTGMAGAFATLIAEHRAAPRDDMLSTLIAARDDDSGRLDDDELIATAILFLFAGHETTTSLLAMGSMALIDNPDQRARLLAEPAMAAACVEECLRFDGPTPSMVRIAKEEIEISGQKIRVGERVVALLGSANRDPAMFRAPDHFEIARTPNPHVTFGFGPHFCLGAPLARLEALIALPALHRRFPAMTRADGDVAWSDGMTLRGPLALPVRLG
jgi:cytochrome P450